MKLADHVDHLRELIEAAFDKQFARLGFSKTKQMDAIQVEKLPEEVKAKRERFAVMLENHIGETGGYESAREKLLDELTFTLFNRLAAIKVMEAASLFPPILTKQKEHGDRSFGHKAWLEMNPHMRDEELEGIRDYLKSAFDELGQTLPLYSKAYPYALLPDAISLNDIIDAFNVVDTDAQANESSEETIWQSDDVLGWMYESYNNKKKAKFKDEQKNNKAKTEYNKVSLQSQVYTPRWVVQFLVENSLGKIYLEMYPHSEIKQRFKIANAPTTQIRSPKPLHEVRTIDPACGSGNFLLYAFDFYYKLYLDQIENYGADYDEKDIPKLIIENNLHGIDLDDRAIQLAQLGLFIKAKKKRRTVGELHFKVVSSDFYLPEYAEVKHIFEKGNLVSAHQQEFIEKVWSDLMQAYKFGSLIHIDKELKEQLSQVKERALGETFDSTQKLKRKIVEGDLFAAADYAEHQEFAENFFANLFAAVEQYARTERNTFLSGKTRDAITFLELLTTEYDLATANPPYTDSADFGPDLKEFIEDNYKKPYKFNTNLYATFIKRCYELTGKDGKVAMVHPPTFMYIKTFEDVRKYMIEKTSIDLFVEWGYLGMFHQSARVDAAMYVLDKNKQEKDSTFIKLNHIYEGKRYNAFVEAYDNLIDGVAYQNNYTIPQSKLKIIKSWPFIYWISDEFRGKFEHSSFDDTAMVVSGVKTGDNDRLLRFWWEVDPSDISVAYLEDKKTWVPYSKGGDFNKWFGNIWLCVNYKNDGQEIKKSKNYNLLLPSKSFKKGITYSATSTKGVSFRLLEEHCLFDMKGSSIIFSDSTKTEYALALLNSKLSSYIANCLNGTVETQVGDIKRIPYAEKNKNKIEKLSTDSINIKKHLQKYSLVEYLFKASPFDIYARDLDYKKSIFSYLIYENHLLAQVLINEAIMNELIFQVYNLTEHDKLMVLAKEGQSIGGLPVSNEARDAYLAEEATIEFPMDAIRDFVWSLQTREFSDEERELVESEFLNLYQDNNDLEAFCIRHQINPINVCYWFKQSNKIPLQRMRKLAMEFLANMIREILTEDEDGIIPLVPNAGEKVLLDRIEEKFLEKGFSSAQYSSFDTVIGRPIHEYLNRSFFAELSNHLNMFPNLPKTPFIWHLTSGPEQGFDCYIIIYKWSRDNLLRLRSVYIENRERALQNRQSDIAGNESAEAQNEKDRIFKQLKEIDAFKKKIDELLAEGYNPILDDGVGKNIAPLQKKKMLAYDVLNAGQLKKYLNADW
ncbi:BREX-1 system adenine-specific DNA-methyltransferase PglX [Pseudoalteromonas sp. HL-AS2]|uniref:BREX-1 system adenine-specific DNA-methyltransferase PglX n=2 Tax=Alteromonadales TaxID=135622 RepID=UPI0028160296|nr:BREX-1 system adenine-specific DNA-methyltransferase PglX [Pseudoalteromonas sp. HL-AS2]WMS94476.1 BREX-1 system adenine-specific DNA-methyltransferase PglX [Pseudoalteromonas sp. HL-AS2]